MQPGSLKVEVGDRVRADQVLGLLGNSGNTDAPHLHFHVMDSPSPLLSDGLPFELAAFEGEGVVTIPIGSKRCPPTRCRSTRQRSRGRTARSCR